MYYLAILALFGVSLLGFVIAYMTSRTDSDETVVVANANALLSNSVDGLFVVLDTARGTFQGTVLFVISNLSRLLLLAMLVALSLIMYYGELRILNTLDRLVRRIVYPFMQVGVWQVLHVLKFVYGTFVPLWNVYVVVTTQLTTGMYTIVAKCGAQSAVLTLKMLAQSLVNFFTAFGDFFQMGVFESDFNVTSSVYAVQLAVAHQEDAVSCVCRQLSPLAKIAFSASKPAALSLAANALLNTFVSAVQEPVRIFTNSSFPDFNRTHTHIRDVLYYGGSYLDNVLEIAFKQFFAQLNVQLQVTFPEVFIFGFASHLVTAFMRAVQWIQNILTNVLLPRPSKISDTEFMIRTLSVKPIFVELDMAVEVSGDILQWFLNMIVRAVETTPLADLPSEVPQLLTQSDTQALANIWKHTWKTLFAVPYLAMDATTTILWGSVLRQETSVMDEFKRYDGHWYVENSCEDRVERGEACNCTMTRDTYNPFCGNPTLQSDVFYNVEQVLTNAQTFGWGILKPLGAWLKLWLAVVRITVRAMIRVDDILASEFITYPINNVGKPFTGQPRCTVTNSDTCEYNPTLASNPDKFVCLYSYPDDLISRDESVLDDFYASSDHWCNSLLIEFVLKELTALSEVVVDVLTVTDPACDPYRQSSSVQALDNPLNSDGNILCAAAIAVRAATRLPMNLLRQVTAEIIGLIATQTDLDFDTENRFTELEEVLFASIGTLAAPFPSPFEETVTKIGYAVSSVPIVALRGVYNAILFAKSIILSENVDWNEHVTDCEVCLAPIDIPNGGVGFIYVEARLVYVYIVQVLQALRGIQHEFFQTFIDIANIAMDALSAPVIDWLNLVFKMGMDLLKFFATGDFPATEFFNDLVKIFTKSMTLLARVSLRILGAILDMLGPLGTFLNVFVTVVCKSLYSVLCSITCASSIFGGGCDDTFCGNDKCMSSSQLGTESHPFEHVPRDVFALGWDGDSRCDRVVHAYKDYVWGDMRPLEQIELQECAEQRYIAIELAVATGVELPVDMIYNWKRKYEMMIHGSMGAMLYVRHVMGDNTVYFVEDWKRWNIPDYWLDLFKRTHYHVTHTDFHVGTILETFRGEKGEPSDVFYEVVHAAHHTVTRAHVLLANQPPFQWNITFPEYNLGASQRLVHTMDYAWDIQTEIGVTTPTQCALLDNTIQMFDNEATRIVDYYSGTYMNVTLPHFLAYLQHDSEWVTDFNEYIRRAVLAGATVPDFYEVPSLDGLNAVASCQPVSDNVFEYVGELFECFITGTGDEPLPYVQHNLEYLLKYQFQTCKSEQVQCSLADTDARMERMVESLIACVFVTIGFVVFQSITGFPIAIFVLPIFATYGLIFATHVWNYTMLCWPNAPTCLMDDIFAFTERYLIPGCMCEYFPTLADQCLKPMCYFVSQTTNWETCETKLNALYGGEHYNIMWSSFMFVREYMPDLLKAMQYFPPLYQSETFSAWVERVPLPVTALEQDCIRFHILDNVFVVIVALASLFFASTVVGAVIKLACVPFKILPSLTTLLYSMLVSLDRQTMPSLESVITKEMNDMEDLAEEVEEELDDVDDDLDKLVELGVPTQPETNMFRGLIRRRKNVREWKTKDNVDYKSIKI